MRYLTLSALAAGLVLAVSSATWASDIVRLGGPSAESTIQGATDIELVRYGYGGYGRGHYGHGHYGHGYGRGYYGGGYGYGRGYYGGYGRGYYGNYYGGGYGRGYYGSYYGRGYYGGGYGNSYYGGGYGNSYYGGGYGNGYYGGGYGRGYYGGYGGGYYGIAGCEAPVVTLQAPIVSQAQYQQPGQYYQQPGQYSAPVMPPAADSPDGTYPYNGGPANPIPQPANNPIPTNRGIVPLDGKLVSLPSAISGGVSPVSLNNGQRYTFVSTTSAPVSRQLNPAPARIAYPAYGDVVVPQAPRKNAVR